MRQIIEVPLDKLIVMDNIREVSQADPDTAALAASMSASGLEIEIRVYPVDGGCYAVKHGHRRLAAAKLLGWETIRAVVDEPPAASAELLIARYNENNLRKPMNYLERAKVFKQLKGLGLTQADIAHRLGTNENDVSLSLQTLQADPRLQLAINKGRISPSAIRALLGQPDDVQAALADAAIAAKTNRKITALVAAHRSLADAAEVQPAGSQVNIPEDADPLEYMAASEINEALEHLRAASLTPLVHPLLVKQTRPTVAELCRLAASIKANLEG